MRSVTMIVLLAASIPAPAKELMENGAAGASDSIQFGVETLVHLLIDRLVDRLVGNVLDRELKAWQFHHVGLHHRIVEKHAHLAVFPSHKVHGLHIVGHSSGSVGKDATPVEIGEAACEGHQYTPEQCEALGFCQFNSRVGQCMPSRRAALCMMTGALSSLKNPAWSADAPGSPLEESVTLLDAARCELLTLLDRLALTMVSTGLKRQQTLLDLQRRLNGGDLGDLRRICERTDKYLGELPLRGFQVQLKQYEEQVKSYESQVKRQSRDGVKAAAQELPWRPGTTSKGSKGVDASVDVRCYSSKLCKADDVPLSTALLISLRLFADGVDLAAAGDLKMTDAGLERLADDVLKKMDAYIRLAESRRQLAGLQKFLSTQESPA